MFELLPGDDDVGRRAAARARVRAAEAECLLLYRLLPGAHGWNGPAAAVFRLRVAGLRAHIDAAHAALVAAEAEL